MPDTIPFVSSASFDRGRLEPFEVGQVQWMRRFGEGDRPTAACGFWVVTPEDAPEQFTVVGEADETVFILEGRLTIEVEGEDALELTAGSSASFNRGVTARWTIHEPVVEFFVYS
jgi:hypothetical protein